MNLQQKFDDILGSLTLNGAGLPSFLLAVSGGVDSMTLATLFLNSNLHPKFEVAHVNFSLRGEESDSDEALVREWCREHCVQMHTKSFDTRKYADEKGISIEMAARELRYGWFDSLLQERGLELLAVAHNLNDNVETLFLNLLRGTGLKGAGGMQMLNGRTFRPLLKVSREEIEAFAGEAGVMWRTDRTNLESEFARNRIRNEVFPQLKRINPSFLQSIAASMEHFAQAEQVLGSELEQKMPQLTRNADDSLQISISALGDEKHLSYWLFRLLEPYGFNAAQLQEIEASLIGGVGKIFRSPSHTLVRDREYLKIYPNEAEIRQPQVTLLESIEGFDPRKLAKGTLCVDADLVTLPLKARAWQEGDRFKPFGMNGTRLVSDLLTDLKLDREQKRRQSIVIDASGRIVCIGGIRIDDRFRITDKTKRVLIIS